MFLKVTKSGKYEYIQIVRSFRENNSTKHEVILNLGRKDTIQGNPSFQRLARRLLEISEPNTQLPLDNVSEAEILNWGYLVYKKLWQKFGLHEILKQIADSTKIQFSLNDTCFLMAVQHLLSPRSKLATFLHQHQYAKLPKIELNWLYRSLDILSAHKGLVEEKLFQKNRNLFNMQVDVVFFDVTTFAFESVHSDGLKDFGFSKDNKFNEVQVVMGLLTDREGRPIGYELFPGNTFDGNTLPATLDKLNQRFGIRRVIIVADRGINSKLNLLRIARNKYHYIFASRIKNLPRKVQQEIFNGGYTELNTYETGFRYKIVEYTNQVKAEGQAYSLPEKLILTYSPKRAEKDYADRQRLLDKAQEYLSNPSRLNASFKRGGKKFLKKTTKNSAKWDLDYEAVERDTRFDGYYGIQTNLTDFKVDEILSQHHALWKIEESFRIMKTTLEVRPIFHWTESRIKGHFMLCFLAFLLERTLEFLLKELGSEVSPEKIREALNSLNFAKVEIQQQDYYIKTKSTSLAKKILRKLKMKPPKNILPVEEFSG